MLAENTEIMIGNAHVNSIESEQDNHQPFGFNYMKTCAIQYTYINACYILYTHKTLNYLKCMWASDYLASFDNNHKVHKIALCLYIMLGYKVQFKKEVFIGTNK